MIDSGWLDAIEASPECNLPASVALSARLARVKAANWHSGGQEPTWHDIDALLEQLAESGREVTLLAASVRERDAKIEKLRAAVNFLTECNEDTGRIAERAEAAVARVEALEGVTHTDFGEQRVVTVQEIRAALAGEGE